MEEALESIVGMVRSSIYYSDHTRLHLEIDGSKTVLYKLPIPYLHLTNGSKIEFIGLNKDRMITDLIRHTDYKAIKIYDGEKSFGFYAEEFLDPQKVPKEEPRLS